MVLKWRRIDPASQPDLFGGVGIQRPEPSTKREQLSQARQEMRDTGADDLFDAVATVTKTPQTKRVPHWTDQSGTRHVLVSESVLYKRAVCGVVSLDSQQPVIRVCEKCSG